MTSSSSRVAISFYHVCFVALRWAVLSFVRGNEQRTQRLGSPLKSSNALPPSVGLSPSPLCLSTWPILPLSSFLPSFLPSFERRISPATTDRPQYESTLGRARMSLPPSARPPALTDDGRRLGGAAVLRVMRFAFRWTEIEFLMSILSVRPPFVGGVKSLPTRARSRRRGRTEACSMISISILLVRGARARAYSSDDLVSPPTFRCFHKYNGIVIIMRRI